MMPKCSDLTLNPWKKLSTRTVYQNSFVSLREDQVLNPDGSPSVYAVYNIRYAVGIVALDSDLNIHLIGQYRYAIDEYAWEIVEGGADEGENPLAAAKRELLEETGITARSWSALGEEVHISNCHTNERARVFLAEDLEFSAYQRETSELLEMRKLPYKEVLLMAERGEIKDALSLIGLYRLAARLAG